MRDRKPHFKGWDDNKYYNELIFDPGTFNRNLPHSIEAVWYLTRSDCKSDVLDAEAAERTGYKRALPETLVSQARACIHRGALDEARNYTVDVRPLAAVLRERGLRDAAEDGAWAAIAQVVVETHTTETRAAVLALLGKHYPTVGARDDDEIEGHAIVYARR